MGIPTMLTKCYSASCGEGIVCYSYTTKGIFLLFKEGFSPQGNQTLHVLPPPTDPPLSPRLLPVAVDNLVVLSISL